MAPGWQLVDLPPTALPGDGPPDIASAKDLLVAAGKSGITRYPGLTHCGGLRHLRVHVAMGQHGDPEAQALYHGESGRIRHHRGGQPAVEVRLVRHRSRLDRPSAAEHRCSAANCTRLAALLAFAGKPNLHSIAALGELSGRSDEQVESLAFIQSSNCTEHRLSLHAVRAGRSGSPCPRCLPITRIPVGAETHEQDVGQRP